jgi:hypothetical protein
VPQEDGNRPQGHGHLRGPQGDQDTHHQPHRQPSLERVSQEHDGRPQTTASPQHVGGTGVFGAKGARIGQFHDPTDHHGKG